MNRGTNGIIDLPIGADMHDIISIHIDVQNRISTLQLGCIDLASQWSVRFNLGSFRTKTQNDLSLALQSLIN